MSVEAKADEIQSSIESQVNSIGKGKYGRILKMAHTPSADEYKKVCMVAAIGLVVLGVVGFGIMWLMTYLPTYF